jgi:AcrR family transcriptional regulator
VSTVASLVLLAERGAEATGGASGAEGTPFLSDFRYTINLRKTQICATRKNLLCSVIVTTMAATEHLRAELHQPESLRQRKKLATRHALGVAAMRLAVEHGLDDVTVEDIAEAAGVSTRTFNNYFASKYEAICSLPMDRGRLVGWALSQRPADEPLLEAITNAMLVPYRMAEQAPDRDWIAGVRLVVQSPLLQGEYLRTLHATQQALAQAIAGRLGLDLQTDMFPAVLAGAVVSASQVAMEYWLHADPPTALIPLLKKALGQLTMAGPITPVANSVAICCPDADANQGPPR